MACDCRTRVFTCEYSKNLADALKTLNKKALYYFVIYEQKEQTIYLERASLILGNAEDIKQEKDFLMRELIKVKETL